MCNACGFYCCAMDCFDRCGCDGCPDQNCWDFDEDDFDDGGEDDLDHPFDVASLAVRRSFVCEALPGPPPAEGRS